MNAAKDESGIWQTFSNMLSDLDYADDSYLWAYHHSEMKALAVELASTAALLGLGWVGGCVRAWVRACEPACLRAWKVPGTSRDLYTCSYLFCFWVSCNQLLNNQGEIKSDNVNCEVNAMTLVRAWTWTASVQVQFAKIRPLFLPPD